MREVSVIMPVYNAEDHLREAIDSILGQSFTNFEFLICNDGSTDGSEEIVLSYADSRIRYIRNERNEGLIATLNKAIDLAGGKLIARMDADDVALPDRFEKQVAYLRNHPDVDMLATTATLIDGSGNKLPPWRADVENINNSAIRKYLPIDNCIVHPSVMGRAAIFRKYSYRHNQKYSEDYDLWLRLMADGRRIDKLEEALLLYRMLPTSVTRFKKVNLFFRIGRVKMKFAGSRLSQGGLNAYTLKVFGYGIADFIKGIGKEIKQTFKKNEVQTTVD